MNEFIELALTAMADYGLNGVVVVIVVGILWLVYWLINEHRRERDDWGDRFDALQQQSLDTIDKNTEALTKLTTIMECHFNK